MRRPGMGLGVLRAREPRVWSERKGEVAFTNSGLGGKVVAF